MKFLSSCLQMKTLNKSHDEDRDSGRLYKWRGGQSSSTKSVFAALIGDLLVAACKTVAAVWTGSAAMMNEAIHSFVDTTNEVLLLYGIHSSRRKADADHPFGHGREVYFWSFVVSLLIFALGAGVSIYEGVSRILKPMPIESPIVSYIVLAVALSLRAARGWWR
jgi:cation diffusion facilitator family transporter